MTSQTRASVARIIGRPLRAVALALVTLGAAAAEPAPEPEAGYGFGRGLRLGDSGFTLGGYLTGEYQRRRDGRAQLRSSHASLFFWWQGLEDRLKVFGEVDQENALVERRGPAGGQGTQDEERLSLQRLHADWAVGDAATLRLGKFLTPVGRWNVAHAGPLVWTTNRPLLTQSVYPRNVTGLMASGRWTLAGRAVEASFYASQGQEWDADPRQDPFASVRGLRLLAQLDADWQAGASWARYEQRGSRGEPRSLAGLDLLWARHGWELQAEWLRTQARRPLPRPPGGPGSPGPGLPAAALRVEPGQGTYVQGVAPLPHALALVARLEWLNDSAFDQAFRQQTLGLVWRPAPALTLKVEHQWPQGRVELAPEGWTVSLSVLF